MPRISRAVFFRSTAFEPGGAVRTESKKELQTVARRPSSLILNLTERLVEELDGFVDVGLGGVQHGGEAESVTVKAAFADEQAVLPGALHHLRGGFGGGLLSLAVFHQLERLHQPHSAHVANE